MDPRARDTAAGPNPLRRARSRARSVPYFARDGCGVSTMVTVDLPSIARAWKRRDADDFWVMLVSKDGTTDGFLSAVAEALEAEGPERVNADFGSRTPRGYVAKFRYGGDE